MIDKKLIPYGGLKKEPFSGTHHGMRYSFAEMTEKAAQPSPYSFIQNRGALKIHRKKRKNKRHFRSPMREWMKLLPGFSNALKLRNPNG